MSLTQADVLKMSLVEVSAAIKDPKTSAEVQRLMTVKEVATYVSDLMTKAKQDQEEREANLDTELSRTAPRPSTEELAAQAAVVAAEAAETVVPVAPTPVERKKIARDYQVRDEDGKPIGRPTHLEAWSEAELLDKMQEAHVNATRAFHRLKQQKVKFQEQEQSRPFTAADIHAAALKAVEAKDPAEAQRVVRGILETEFAKKEQELQQQKDFIQGQRIGQEFVGRHLYDFNPVRSNMLALTDYLAENNLDFTLDNLEVAFLDLNDQGTLAPVPARERNVEVAANPAPTATATPAPASGTPAPVEPVVVPTPAVAEPQVVSAPVPQATVPTSAAPVNQAPAARRPGVNGSLPPGSMSAHRAIPVDPNQARIDFMQRMKKLTAAEFKHKKDHDPQFVRELVTYGIKV